MNCSLKLCILSFSTSLSKMAQDRDVKLSKTMAFLLRHGAQKAGLKLQPDGFIFVDELLQHHQFQSQVFLESDVIRVVEASDKQRFKLERDGTTGKLKVRANQGHTLQVPDLELTEITDAKDYPQVIHGTDLKAWNIIKKQGLSRMRRTHIHFAIGEPGDNEVISGMRTNSDVLIFIDLPKALKGGLKFFVSANKVVLSPGDADGYIRPDYFLEAYRRSPRTKLL